MGVEADPSRMHVEISLSEGGQLFRVKINQKSHFAVAMRALELLLDLWSVLCPPNSSWALPRAVLSLAGRGRSFTGPSVGSVLLRRELGSLSGGVWEPWALRAGLAAQAVGARSAEPVSCSDEYLASASLLRGCS